MPKLIAITIRHRIEWKNRIFVGPLMLGIIFAAVSTGVSQTLTADERRVIEYVDKHGTEAVSFLEAVVNIESPTEDLAGVRAAGTAFGNEFRKLGMNVRWIEMPPETKRAGHLVAETTGTKGKRLLLLGHLDTVLRGERFRLEGNKAYGTGISDMKGGDVVVLFALKALHAAGALKDTRVIVMFTGDEENSCDPVSVCRGDMVAAAKRSDLALSFEAAVGNTATIGRRGSSGWRLEVEAKTGHSSQIFRDSMGYGAIYEAARILTEFRETLSKEKYLTFNPGMITGGTTADAANAVGSATGKTNVVAARAVVTGDLRFISEEQKEAARVKMREIVAKSLPGTSAKITFEDGIPAMTPVPANYELLKDLDKASQDLGYGKVEALDPGDRGAGDIAFISNIIPGLDGLGIGGGGNSHAKGEWARIDTLSNLTKRTALLIYRLTR